MRPTASYARSYDDNSDKRETLQLDLNPMAQPPPFPADYIGRVNKHENDVLLPRVMELLCNMPDAKRKAINGRSAVLYEKVVFVDTHDLFYLDRCAPDVTVLLDGYGVSSCAALALLELQVRASR